MELRKKSKEPSLFILLLLVSFASVSAVLFTPALPEISKFLGISNGKAQLTMSVFLIGYAIGTLPYGPLSNRLGRKPVIYIGTLLATFASLLIIFAGKAQLFWLFVAGRFLMALGSSVGIKIAFTMVGDVYSHEKATKKLSYILLGFAIAPGLAIALGGILTDKFGWESCFYFLTGYSVLLFILSFFLPETGPEPDPEALNLANIKTGYLQKLKNKKLVTCALLMGCGTSFVYLFASEAPFIGIGRIGLKADVYGLLNFIPPVGMIIGSVCANLLAGKKNPLAVIQQGILISLACSLLILFLFLLDIVTPWSLFIPMPFLYIGLALVFSNASSLAMTHAKNKSNASAVMNFINMGVSVITLFIVEALPEHQPFIMPLFFILIGGAMILLRMRLQVLFTNAKC